MLTCKDVTELYFCFFLTGIAQIIDLIIAKIVLLLMIKIIVVDPQRP